MASSASREEPFAELLQLLNIGVIVQGPQAEIRFCNQAALSLLGLDEDQLLGKTSFDPDWNVQHEDGTHFPGEQHPVPQAIATRQPVYDVVMGVFRPATQDRVWLLVSAEPHLDVDGCVDKVICTFTDISNHRQAEARLHLLESVVVHANDAILLTEAEPFDEPGPRIVYVNEAFTQMTGYSAEEVIGKTPRLLQGPKTERKELKTIRAALERWESVRVELVNYRKDGSEFWVELNIVPVCDQTGRYTHWIAIQRDTTEHKQAESALRKSSKRIVNILESMSEAFLSIDSKGRCTYLNPQAEELLGKSRQTMLGRLFWDELPDAENTLLYRECQRALAKNTAVELEEYFPQLDVWLRARAFPSTGGLSVYLENISHHKRAQEELRRSVEKLRRSLEGVVNAMALTVELRDPYTGAHQRRVSALATRIAVQMEKIEEEVEIIRIAGLLHDLGKISLPAEILSKPGRLSAAEISIIQTHAQVGYDVLKGIELPPQIALVALQHHERLDGSGYPNGLFGDAIIPEAQIMAVADVVEAMTSHRPYRPGFGIERALEEVLSQKGKRYDAQAVDACLKVFAASGFDLDQVMGNV